MDQQKKNLINPENNVLQLRAITQPRTSVFIAKIYLKKFDNIELHALGDAITKAVRVADTLQRQGLATIEKINTFTQRLERGSRAKIVVNLTVTPEGKKRIQEEIKQ